MSRHNALEFVRSIKRQLSPWERHFEGYAEEKIEAAAGERGVVFPRIYQAYLCVFGKRRGALFQGSDVADLENLDAFQEFGNRMFRSHLGRDLPANSVVFLIHQGTWFLYFLSDGGYDSPIFGFSEGEEEPRPMHAGFGPLLETQVEQVLGDSPSDGPIVGRTLDDPGSPA